MYRVRTLDYATIGNLIIPFLFLDTTDMIQIVGARDNGSIIVHHRPRKSRRA